MSGQRTGVAKRIQELEPGQSNHAHFESHALNVTASGMLKQGAVFNDAMSTSHENIKLLKYSPKKEDIPSNQGEHTRRQWQNRCSNHVPYQMDR